MDSNNIIIKYLVDLGYNLDTEYYQNIKLWKEWDENNVPKFHEYHDQNGELKKLYKLGMAKRICEDWSSILYTERDSVVCENENNQKFIDKWLPRLKFRDKLPDIIEMAFWSGTAGTILRIKNAKIENKKIVSTENTTMNLVSVNASQIIPLKTIDGEIQDIAFVSKSFIENKKVYYIEIHENKGDKYLIKNIYIDENGKEVTDNNTIHEYYVETKIFNLLSPKILNNLTNNGMGISIYGNAIDQLKASDTIYNNFVMDFYLGGKKVFYNKKLTKYQTLTKRNEDGTTEIVEIPIFPDDVTKQQFQVIGDEASVNDDTLIHEHNPDLRVSDNESGLNLALNMLSFKCGLGKKYYKFQDGSVVTATEALINDRDLTGNAKKHRSAVNEYTVGLIKSLLCIGRTLFGENVNEDDKIKLIDKDGFLQSEEQQKEQYLTEISAGIRSKTSYLMKFYGVSKEDAKKELILVNEEDSLTSMDVEGGE